MRALPAKQKSISVTISISETIILYNNYSIWITLSQLSFIFHQNSKKKNRKKEADIEIVLLSESGNMAG